ncbi:MAG: DivIVA domain-containing protein [Nocardioidaceae bacterium]|nr:DivIVA domain-containing protein [Nocardioidaceae bacterium]
MTSNDGQRSPDYRSPASIRNQDFRRRRRGLDPEEVFEYVDQLAAQIERSESELRRLREHNEQLRGETHKLVGEIQEMRTRLTESEVSGEDRINDQVVQLFSQAQLVAEEMVEDISRDARERLGHARAQERQIIDEAMQTAERTRREAEAMINRTAQESSYTMQSSLGASSGDVDQVRSFAQSAQAQMQSIMDTFAAQVAELGGGRGYSTQYVNGSAHEHNGWQIEPPRGRGDQRGSA